LTEIEATVNAKLQDVIADLQQQKRPGRRRKAGDHTPKGGERLLNDAAAVDPAKAGNVKRSRKANDATAHLERLRPEVRWVDWAPDADIGKCELESHKADIEVNQNHPTFINERNDRSLMHNAMVLLAEALSQWEGPQLTMKLQTPEQSRKFVSILSVLLTAVAKQYQPIAKAA
jgi:hypothetical protein